MKQKMVHNFFSAAAGLFSAFSFSIPNRTRSHDCVSCIFNLDIGGSGGASRHTIRETWYQATNKTAPASQWTHSLCHCQGWFCCKLILLMDAEQRRTQNTHPCGLRRTRWEFPSKLQISLLKLTQIRISCSFLGYMSWLWKVALVLNKKFI